MPEVNCVLVGRPCAVQVALMGEQDSELECCRSDRLVALRRFQARAWMRCFRAMRLVSGLQPKQQVKQTIEYSGATGQPGSRWP